jgi:outer membrane protein
MKFKIRCIFVFVIISAAHYYSLADVENSTGDTLLTLKKLVDLAIENGTTTLLSKNQIKLQQINVRAANSDFLPEVRSAISASEGRGGKTDWSGSNDISAGISYSFSPSSIPNVQSAEKKQSSSEFQYQQTIDEVRADAIKMYIDAVYTLKRIEIAKKEYEYQKLKLQQIEEYRNAGKRSLSDVLQQQTITAESEAALLDAKQGYERAMLSLFNVASLPLNTHMAPDTNGFTSMMSSLSLPDSSVVPVLDLDVIAEFQAKKRDIEASELSYKSVKAAYIPSISGSLNSGTAISGSEGFSEPDLRASVSISYPIFDKFQRKQKIQAAQLNLDNTQIQLRELEKSIRLEYQHSISDLQMARKQLEVAMVRLLSARQALDAVMARYESGMSTLVETALANNSYLSAVDARLKAEISILTSYVSLLKITGSIDSFMEKNVN